MMKTVWITKYAMTIGIVEHTMKPDQKADEKYVKTVESGWGYFIMGKEAHASREEAIACANKMRTAKLASLRKTIDKLEARDFSAPKWCKPLAAPASSSGEAGR